MPQKHAKASLMSEVSIDCEVSDKFFRMEDLYGIFVTSMEYF